MSIQGTAGEADADWVAATRVALVAAVGEGAASTLLDRLLPVIPAGYDELNWPNSASVDLPIVDRVAGAVDEPPVPGAVRTAMLHFVEAAENQWRFRVYHGGAAVPIADLLPLLDNLGFRAIDERAFHFDLGDRSVWLHDVGVQVPEGVELTEQARAEVQRAFVDEFCNTVEVDGLNRLVLLAGLTARQVEVLRAYSRYLRQIGFPFSQQYIEATLCRHAS
ncbi:MAG: NAD-glutamate dehydrogenase, partial [Actinomycetota bacterium]|nr:NAD-glutamate dehydrogenase [Actinomycetota bacterium]